MSQPVDEVGLYERNRNEPAITAAVERFDALVIADPELKRFFNGVGMSPLKAHQLAFLCQALGGPKLYNGASMRDPHSRHPIEQRHFDGVAVHLVKTYRELTVLENITGATGASLTPLSEQIVNTPARSAVARALRHGSLRETHEPHVIQ